MPWLEDDIESIGAPLVVLEASSCCCCEEETVSDTAWLENATAVLDAELLVKTPCCEVVSELGIS